MGIMMTDMMIYVHFDHVQRDLWFFFFDLYFMQSIIPVPYRIWPNFKVADFAARRPYNYLDSDIVWREHSKTIDNHHLPFTSFKTNNINLDTWTTWRDDQQFIVRKKHSYCINTNIKNCIRLYYLPFSRCLILEESNTDWRALSKKIVSKSSY